jgi:ribosomal protein S8
MFQAIFSIILLVSIGYFLCFAIKNAKSNKDYCVIYSEQIKNQYERLLKEGYVSKWWRDLKLQRHREKVEWLLDQDLDPFDNIYFNLEKKLKNELEALRNLK